MKGDCRVVEGDENATLVCSIGYKVEITMQF